MALHQTYLALNDGQHGPEGDLDHLHPNFSWASIDHFTPEIAGDQTESASSTAREHLPKSKSPRPKPEPRIKIGRYDWNGSWTWEIAAAILSVVGFALLIGFLVKIQNTPYASWQYTASPNTVVSIIVGITKAALLVPVSACLSQLKWNHYRSSAPLYHMQAIDQASRGPWGSMEVLWRGIPGLRMDSLTLVGAFITIVALAIDPFSQQVLSFPSRSVYALNETASIQRAHRYSPPGLTDSDGNQLILLSPSMMGAIMSGLAQTNRPLEPECGSGNCIYPSFVSLGVCSHCEDFTARANQSCQSQENSAFWDGLDTVWKEIPVNCTYTLPGGSQVNLPFEDIFLDVTIGDPLPITLEFWISRLSSGELFDIQKPIISFIVANMSSTTLYYSPENVTVPLPKPSLTGCALWYCEKEYSPSSFSTISKDGWSLNVSFTQQLVPGDPSGVSVALLPPDGRHTLSDDPSYIVDYLSADAPFQETLNSLFDNTTISSDNAYFGSGTLSLTEFLRDGNLTQLLDSMSTSITDTFRADNSSGKVPGKAYLVETFINVHWPWIILPGSVILGSLALLLATAVASQKQHAVLWKSSVLPLLMSHLETVPEYEIASLRNVDQVHHMSERIHVTMDQSSGPPVFVEG